MIDDNIEFSVLFAATGEGRKQSSSKARKPVKVNEKVNERVGVLKKLYSTGRPDMNLLAGRAASKHDV
mgnify:CR=1 FL=1